EGAAPSLGDADARSADVARRQNRLPAAEIEGVEDARGPVDREGAVPDAPVHAELAVEFDAVARCAGGAAGGADGPPGGAAVGDAVGRDAPGARADLGEVGVGVEGAAPTQIEAVGIDGRDT